ncbi:Binding-protein-dependent transport systems inner membrane component [uncultured Eubacteriales bacterium]|uniref:Binding-protein-dependent transport systems inner membrane component n=1 Tax=uncultured Eubacteriales bacterium TaxID=172733 RepID=A0A212JPW9_9FIRM|nr:Binding-protein-dependent transport systems inner membrane component [uncultured Eubacteriales bacterium]
MSFFKKYREKREGAIRFYDLNSPGTRVACVLIFLACILMLVIAIFPVIWVMLGSFKDIAELRNSTTILPKSFDLAGIIGTWKDLKFTRYYINSAISAAGSIVCAVVFNGLLAYVLAIVKPRGHMIIFGLVMWAMLIPPTTSIVALFVNINRLGLTNSFLPLWLSMGANAFWVVLFKQYFEGLPKEYIEAAQLDGCSQLQVFLRIILPLSKPIVTVVAIFALTAAWNDFLLPYLVLSGGAKETVMVRLFSFRTNIRATDADILRGVLFAILPPAIVFALFQKQITSGVAAGGIKG